MSRIIVSLAILSCASIPALAADELFDSAPAIYSWSGVYIGGHVGYAWGKNHIDNLGFAESYSYDVNGALAGGQIGVNWQSGSLVFGLEADISYKGLDGDDGGTAGVLDEIDARWGGTARVRAGWAFDRSLLYATGGLAWLNYRYTSSISGPGPASPAAGALASVSFSDTNVGWTIGGGYEHAFGQNWSAKLEYLYSDFGDRSRTAAIFAAPWETSLSTHEVRFGINYRFGGN